MIEPRTPDIDRVRTRGLLDSRFLCMEFKYEERGIQY